MIIRQRSIKDSGPLSAYSLDWGSSDFLRGENLALLKSVEALLQPSLEQLALRHTLLAINRLK